MTGFDQMLEEMPKENSGRNRRNWHLRFRLQVVAGVGDSGFRQLVYADALAHTYHLA